MNKKPLLWKFLLILGVVAAAAAFSYPPQERINLGLDLRGGSHIVLQVDPASAVKFQIDRTSEYISRQLDRDELAHESVLPTGAVTIEVTGTDPAARDAVRASLTSVVASGGPDPWSVENMAAGRWRVTMPAAVRSTTEKRAIDNTLTILRNRINSLGVSEPLIQKQVFEDRILVQIPGVQDVSRIKDIIITQANLEWKEVSYPEGAASPGRWLPPTSPEATTAMFGGQLPEDTVLVKEPLPDGKARTGKSLSRGAARPLLRDFRPHAVHDRGVPRRTATIGVSERRTP